MDKLIGSLSVWFPRHRITYVVVIGGLTIFNMLDGPPWWAVWPMMIWGLVLLIHLCIVKACQADDEWVAQRALELRYKSYDFGHMKDLERRIGERDFSVEPYSDQDLKEK